MYISGVVYCSIQLDSQVHVHVYTCFVLCTYIMVCYTCTCTLYMYIILINCYIQVAEYNKLKTKAGKKAASLNQQLERVYYWL